MGVAFVIVMGVAGCGKSTVGMLLADRLGVPFADADDFHSEDNKRKMASGIGLSDSDRQPWLEELAKLLAGWKETGSGGVLACSALKEKYRDALRSSGTSPLFVYLEIEKEVARARLAERSEHYMKPVMVDSQFATLEVPHGKDALAISAMNSPAQIVSHIIECLAASSPS